MAKFRKQIGRWSDADDHALVAEFGAGTLQSLIESRVASLMARYAGDRVSVECAPAPKPRTLDDIASELRMAREDAARLAIAFVEAGRAAAHAEKRMDELRAELTRAVEEV